MSVLESAVVVRRLRADDASAFRDIRLEALKAAPELLRSTFEREDKLDVAWFAGRLEDAYIVGAVRSGELVGTAGFSIQQGQPNLHKGRVWGQFVLPSVRNLGIRRLMLGAVLDFARESVEVIQLSVVQDNGPARRLYESFGFREFGVEQKASKYGETYYDEALMAIDFRSQPNVA